MWNHRADLGATIDGRAPGHVPLRIHNSGIIAAAFVLSLALSSAAMETWVPLPLNQWQGNRFEVAAESNPAPATVGYPAKHAGPLRYETPIAYPPGLYRVEIVVRPSHVGGPVAWDGKLTLTAGESSTTCEGIGFSRPHGVDTRAMEFVHPAQAPIRLSLAASVDPQVFEDFATSRLMKQGGPALQESLDPAAPPSESEPGAAGWDELTFVLSPDRAFYYLLAGVPRLRRLSASGVVTEMTTAKIRYEPGEMLRGHAILRNLGQRPVQGALHLDLEWGLADREAVKEIPVTLDGASRRVDFEFALPREELGYALAATFVSTDGKDRSEKKTFFTIADNFYRVAMFAAHILHHGGAVRGETTIRPAIEKARQNYANCLEFFSWAEDDLAEMSPDTDYWFSGQTCYHQSRDGLKTTVRLAHEQGMSVVTYGKFSSVGYPGWALGYAVPDDYKSQYDYAPGMWSPVNVTYLDRMRFKEFVPLTTGPTLRGPNVFQVAWQTWPTLQHFVPDLTPRMVRWSAEEVTRSIDLFGWDGIRWDGHPSSGWAHGGNYPEQYSHADARKTETLMRYFKQLVGERHPRFRHGYNYLNNMETPNSDWALEDFELDELCRGGGLLMNESMKMAAGQSYEWAAKNLQVQGDLARERGGFLLSFEPTSPSPRDALASKILLLAAGARPAFADNLMETLRYATRYSRYCFDETLRRLARPEGVLRPAGDTTLWWDPFVYETAATNGRAQLVVNLINLPRSGLFCGERAARRDVDLALPPASAAMDFAVSLPATHVLTGATLIDPFSLNVTPLPCTRSRVTVPPVKLWAVAILDLEVSGHAAPLAGTWGPRPTLGVQRQGLEIQRTPTVTVNAKESDIEVNNLMARLFPAPAGVYDEKPELRSLGWKERNQALLKAREGSDTRASFLATNEWWKGGAMLQDVALKDRPPAFDSLAPIRNGVVDIYYARNMMDHSLRLYDSFARLDRTHVDEGHLAGQCRSAATGQYLENAISAARFPDYDLIVYADIPHCAIGVEESYALVRYVQQGGAVLFTGGMYAFGRGAYQDTILDRELLPVSIVDLRDTRIVRDPLVLEPGPDFPLLGVHADFSAKPAVWCWNEVAIRDGAEVTIFLKAGNRPMLVGWQLGAGRVACLLPTHRGKTEDGVTAFFDWSGWPQVQEAVLRWLTPDAGKILARPPVAPAPGVLAAFEKEQDGGFLDGLLEQAEAAPRARDAISSPGEPAPPPALILDEAALTKRTELLRSILAADQTHVAPLMAEQFVTLVDLPESLWHDMIEAIRRTPPPALAALATTALRSDDSSIRGRAAMLLAIANGPTFIKLVRDGNTTPATAPLSFERHLALALTLYERDDLKDIGRRRLTDWAAEEDAVRDAYTGGKGFSLAAPEQPCLGSEALFQRLGWLAYMTRWEPEAYATDLGREWLMIAEYADYCDRTIAQLWRGMEKASPSEQNAFKARIDDALRLKRLLDVLDRTVQPRVEALLRSHPEKLAAGFAQVGFLLPARKAQNCLGMFPAADVRSALGVLKTARQPTLAAFAATRLAAASPASPPR